ncbi:SH3 domain-containing C40 family peptidase [Abyssisolibacter fermentans]|uniref:C40 family peptidase n=1 Tax=Abyssisolibacter fermentans TaxID=1766203 RepID=UPI00082C4192|nr:SH3 domain-containing C40 family peptidase [Abyssisolibacter fermentans]
MKKTIKSFLIISFSIFVLLLIPYTANAEKQIEGKIIGTNINIKKELNQNSQTLGTLNLGQRVEIIGQKNNWTQIKIPTGLTGWIETSYIVPVRNIEYFKKGLVTAELLNARQQPSINSNILTQESKDSLVLIVDKKNEWYEILLENSKSAWIHSDYIQLISLYPKWTASENVVNMRKSYSLESTVVTKLIKGTNLFILDKKDDWFKVSTGDNIVGWVYDELAKPSSQIPEASLSSRSDTRLSTKIVNVAKQYLGVPYVYGAAGPSRFDCSGFTQYVYKKNGISIPRTSKTQGKYGQYISRNNLQPGDLVFLDTSGKYDKVITHCGIYIGDGKFIHASSTKKAITISNLNSGYYNSKYVTARRPY